MCRHLAYVGAPIAIGTLLSDPPFSLVHQAWAPRRQRNGVVNADGFGVGWYVDGATMPARHRGAGPVWADETFAELCRVIRTGSLLAAVRSATQAMIGGQSVAAAAPFRHGSWLFSHNGAVAGWPGSAARLSRGLDPGVLATLDAHTDSAVLWALLIDLLSRGLSAAAALSGVIARVIDAGGGRATMLLTDGATITATVWGTSLCWRPLPGGVVVASEPYDDGSDWVDVADRSLLTTDGDDVTVEPLPNPEAGVDR